MNIFQFAGYASVFDVVDSQNHMIVKNAFNRTLKEKRPSDIKILWQHNAHEPMGQCTYLAEDQYGLYFEAAVSLETKLGYESYKLIEANFLNNLSIGYKILNQTKISSNIVTIITEIDLWEISIVTFAANNLAKITRIIHQDETISWISLARLAML